MSADIPAESTSIPSWLQVPKDDQLTISSTDSTDGDQIDTPAKEPETEKYSPYSNEQSSGMDNTTPDTGDRVITESTEVNITDTTISQDTLPNAPIPSWLQNIETETESTESIEPTESKEITAEEGTSGIIEENPIVENKE